MSSPTEYNRGKLSISTMLPFMQFAVLCPGVGAVLIDIGRKTEVISSTSYELQELKYIVHDLVKSQLTIVANDAVHTATLEDLKDRILILEEHSNAS